MASGTELGGEVFKASYEQALEYMHPEDAASVAMDALGYYFDYLGISRPIPEDRGGMVVRVANVEDIARALMRAQEKRTPPSPALKVKNPGGGGPESVVDVVDRNIAEGIGFVRRLGGEPM